MANDIALAGQSQVITAPVDQPTPGSDTDAMPDVSVLVQWFESAEEATLDARKLSERDRDYYDNKQLTSEEIKTLKERGQPIVITNLIKSKIDFLSGLEKRQRAVPKAMPRTPVEDENANSATDAIKYVCDDQEYQNKRSQVWRNMCIEGAGGFAVGLKPCKNYPGEYDVDVRRISWNRMFADPHSCEADYSDAMYLGVVVWMDAAEAKSIYGDVADIDTIISDTMNSVSQSQTYDDKPDYMVWADRKRKRVRIVQMYFRPDGQTWHYAEFTKGGLLKGGVSPYLDDEGEPDCEFIFQAAYVDRENNRYGPVRQMIGPQDEYNKRGSKLLHLLSVRQIRFDPAGGSTMDIEKVRRELAKPDGAVEASKDGLEILTNADQTAGQFRLMEMNLQSVERIGANASMLGEQGGAPSGKAIQLNQSGGMIELGDLLDGLRHLDRRVFKAIFCRIRQGWKGPKWVRVTDDERNLRFVGFNVTPDPAGLAAGFGQPPQAGQAPMQPGQGQIPPEMMQPQKPGDKPMVTMLQKPIAELDVDIIVDDSPDNITTQEAQFESLVKLKQADPESIPTEMLVECMPGLRNRDKILDMLAKKHQPNPEMQDLQRRGAEAEVGETESKIIKNLADAGVLGTPTNQAETELKTSQARSTDAKTVLAARELDHKVGHETFNAVANADNMHTQNQQNAQIIENERQALDQATAEANALSPYTQPQQ